jgi:hypothetical protein
MRWPNKLGGSPRLVGWLNAFLDACRSGEIKTVIGGRIIESSDGKTIVIDSERTLRQHRFPFQIYQALGNPALTSAQHTDKDWRTFRVRSGWLGRLPVDLTDNVLYPDGDEVPGYSATWDFVLTSGEAYVWVWINAADPADPYIEMSETPPVGGWNSTTGWDDGYYILLGWVNTETVGSAKVRQLVRADLLEYFETSVCISGVWTTIRLPARISA